MGQDGPLTADATVAAPVGRWLVAWREGRKDRVLASLASGRLGQDVQVDEAAKPRVDSRGAVAVLRAFLDLLPEEEAAGALDMLVAQYPACRHAWILRGERALAAQRSADAVADFKRALSLRFDDLRVQRMLVAANLQLPAAERSPEIAAASASLQGRFCGKPFSHFETTENGDVYVCCPSYLPVPIGNIGDSTPDAIWNSASAQELRRSILDGDFSYCSRLSCPAIQSGELQMAEAVASAVPEAGATGLQAKLHTDLVTRALKVAHGPSFVNLSHDRSCNLSCPSCRTRTIIARPAEQARLDRVRDEVVLPVLKTADRVLITGSGDPFGSKHFRDVLEHLNPQEFPSLRVDLQTNGQLFTEREWLRLRGLHSMIHQVYVSIDAAEEATYAEVRRGGSFAKVCANMAFLGGLRRAGHIRNFVSAFVVQASNFRQMERFVEFGLEWGVDRITFSRLRQWGTYSGDDFAKRDIFSPAHPEHAAFRAVLRSEIFKNPIVRLGNIHSYAEK